MRIGIVGTGITGLACAHYLLRAGHHPVVFETECSSSAANEPFLHDGIEIDPVPHSLLDSDSALCGLMADLGALGQLAWKDGARALVADRQLHPWESPADLLRFDAIPALDRLRATLVCLYLTRIRRYALDLDRVPAWDWLLRLFGDPFFELVWAPLLRAQFGERCREAPAYWAWRMLNRHMRGCREVRGYVRGGFGWLLRTLRASIESRGGEIRTRGEITAIHSAADLACVESDGHAESFDAVISTLEFPELENTVPHSLLEKIPTRAPEYRDLLSIVLLLRSPLSHFYTTNITSESLPFHTIIETTNVMSTSCTGGHHLAYLLSRHRSKEEPQVSEGVLIKEAIEGLLSIHPGLDPEDIAASYCFRIPNAAPVWRVGGMDSAPPIRVGRSRIYLCMNAQAYPRIPSWDTSVALARETTSTLSRDFA